MSGQLVYAGGPWFKLRARDWLRQYTIEWRDSVLLEHGDAAILNMAEEDGCWLTCLGDIQRERDRAVLRSVPAEDAA